MKKLCFCLVLGLTSLSAEIVETFHFSKILDYVTSDTLVVLDIDDTLLLPRQTLGSDVWFIHRLSQQLKNLGSYEKALEKTLAEWEGIRHLTEVRIVEEGSDGLIRELQDKGIRIMGLTTQGLALATRTIQQLETIGFDLTLTAPSQEEHYFEGTQIVTRKKNGVLFRKGLLFTAGTEKGQALLNLLERSGYSPKHVVFINDKETHLKDVEKTLEERGIPFTGLRYSYGDERVASFDPQLADYQWNHSSFGHILSDEEAAQALDDNTTQAANR